MRKKTFLFLAFALALVLALGEMFCPAFKEYDLKPK